MVQKRIAPNVKNQPTVVGHWLLPLTSRDDPDRRRSLTLSCPKGREVMLTQHISTGGIHTLQIERLKDPGGKSTDQGQVHRLIQDAVAVATRDG